MSTQPANWIKHIESLLIQSQDIPTWGTIPSFPWKEFTEMLCTNLNIKDLKIFSGTIEWKDTTTLLTGLGRNPLQLALEFSPIQGSFSIVFPSEDFAKLSSWAIHPETANAGFSDPYLQKGFFRYLCIEALSAINHLQVFKGITPKIIDTSITKEKSYCIDVAIEHEGTTIWGRVICPPLFQKNFKAHFMQDWNFSIPSNLYQEVFLNLSLAAGETTLSQDTWENLNEGDFVLLDHCSYYPKLKKGTFQLQLNHTPLFQVKAKEESMKILDYAHYFKENNMSDENFEEPFTEPIEEDQMEAAPVEEAPEQPMLSPKKVPISLTIEVAKISLNLDKLLKLRPGNVLHLGIQPDNGVNLVSNGQCIGKGELVQIEDTIGVKITQLGK